MHTQWTGKPKVRHATVESAEVHLLDMIKKHPEDKYRWEIYKCWCQGYHVGHSKLPHNEKTDPTLGRLVGQLIGALRGTLPVSDLQPSDVQSQDKGSLRRKGQLTQKPPQPLADMQDAEEAQSE